MKLVNSKGVSTGYGFQIFILVFLLIFASVLHLVLGAVSIDWYGMLNGGGNAGRDAGIFFFLRLPRLTAALFVGASLSLAGTLTQTTLQNPLASPDILGVTTGAGIGAFLVIRAGLATLAPLHMPAGAFFGGMVIALVLFLVSRQGGGKSLLLLAGLGLGSLGGALISLLLFLSREVEVRQFFFWTLGGLEMRGWDTLSAAVPFLIFGLVLGLTGNRKLDYFLLGDDGARVMGIDVRQTRLRSLGTAVLLTSASVSVAGPLPFLGLLGPHLTRRFFGSRTKELVPASALVGSLLLVAADTLSRILSSPFELRTGILLALVGAPIFLLLLLTSRQLRG